MMKGILNMLGPHAYDGYVLEKAMVERREIKKWCQSVARKFRPQRIILFGSYTYGTATDDSDVDVLVVMPLARGRRDVHQAASIRARVLAPFPMDVLVRTPRQIARRLAQGDGFMADVLRHGRVMYENKHSLFRVSRRGWGGTGQF